MQTPATPAPSYGSAISVAESPELSSAPVISIPTDVVFIEEKQEETSDFLTTFLNGKASPTVYYMALVLLTAILLATAIGLIVVVRRWLVTGRRR